MNVRLWFCGLSLAVLVGCSQPPAAAPGATPQPAAVAPAPANEGPMEKCTFEKLTRAERVALDDASIIALFASLCGNGPGRELGFDTLYNEGCSSELAGGSKMQVAALRGQMKDPRGNPDYQFEFKVSGNRTSVAFHPQHSGVAGVYSDGVDVYCNVAGKASPRRELFLGNGAELGQKLHPSKKGK